MTHTNTSANPFIFLLEMLVIICSLFVPSHVPVLREVRRDVYKKLPSSMLVQLVSFPRKKSQVEYFKRSACAIIFLSLFLLDHDLLFVVK